MTTFSRPRPTPPPSLFSLRITVSLSPPADGGELPPHVDQRNGQLHFTKVTRNDAGNYTCIATNSLQGEIRALVTLTVAGEYHSDHKKTVVGRPSVLHQMYLRV